MFYLHVKEPFVDFFHFKLPIKKNPTIRFFCMSGWLAVPINPYKRNSAVLMYRPYSACSFYFFFSHDLCLPTQCRWLLLHVITLHDTHTHTLGRKPTDRRSGKGSNLYLTTHNNHKRDTPMLPAGFEPAIPTSEQLQTHAIERAATGIVPVVLQPEKPSSTWQERVKAVCRLPYALSCTIHRTVTACKNQTNSTRIWVVRIGPISER